MNKKMYIIGLLALLLMIGMVGSVSAIDISSCPFIITSSGTYDLINNISCAGMAINVSANNVIIDLHGYTINGTDNVLNDDGVWVKDFNYTTVKNGIIINEGAGIYFRSGSNFNKVINVTLFSNAQFGIATLFSSYNNFTNITTISNDAEGIFLQGGSNNILININSSLNAEGIGIDTSSFNILENIYISHSDAIGIALESSSHNRFTNINISNSATRDVDLRDSVNNTFLNVTYTTEAVSSRQASQLIRNWYYQAKVQDDITNPLQGALVEAENITGILIDSSTTDVNGFTDLMELTEYINNGGTKTFYSNYTITASKSGFTSSSISRNITGNKLDDVITLNVIPPITEHKSRCKVNKNSGIKECKFRGKQNKEIHSSKFIKWIRGVFN